MRPLPRSQRNIWRHIVGLLRNLAQSSAQLFQLRQSLASVSNSTEHLSPLKQYLLALLREQIKEPIQMGPVDLRDIAPAMVAQLTDSQILSLAKTIHGELGKFIEEWTGQISESESDS